MTLSDGIQISWWPSEKNEGRKSKKNPRDDVSLEDDIEWEGKDPDVIFTIPGLDEGAMEEWWNSWKEAGHEYDLVENNCCHIVMKCLCAGGIKNAKEAIFPGVTPLDVEEFLRATEEATKVA